MNLSDIFNKISDVKIEYKKAGNANKIVESDIYKATIEDAYLDVAASGSVSLILKSNLDVDGTTVKNVSKLCIISKAGKSTYGEDDKPLFGLELANALALFAAKTPLKNLQKSAKKAKVDNKEVYVLTEFKNKVVSLALVKKMINSYKDDTKIITVNDLVAVFNEQRFSVFETLKNIEARKNEEEIPFENPIDSEKWLEANQGIVVDKSTATAGNKVNDFNKLVSSNVDSDKEVVENASLDSFLS